MTTLITESKARKCFQQIDYPYQWEILTVIDIQEVRLIWHNQVHNKNMLGVNIGSTKYALVKLL